MTAQSGVALSTESAELDPSGIDAGTKAPPQSPRPRRQREDLTYPGLRVFLISFVIIRLGFRASSEEIDEPRSYSNLKLSTKL